MRIQRLNTASGTDAYALLAFTSASLELVEERAKTRVNLQVEVPESWPFQSVTALAEQALYLRNVPKRLRRIKEAGVPSCLWRHATADNGQNASEHSFKQIFDRVAGALTYTGWKAGYFTSRQDAQTYYDELRFLLASQKLAFAPRLYALTGIYWAYGLTGDLDNGVWLDPNSNRLRTRVLQYEQPLSTTTRAIDPVDFDSVSCAEILAQLQEKTVEQAIFTMGHRLLQQQITGLYDAARTGNDLPGHVSAAEIAGVPHKLIQDTLHAARTDAPCPTVPRQPFNDITHDGISHAVRVTADDLSGAGERWHEVLHAIWQHGDPELFFTKDHDNASDAPQATLNLAAFADVASNSGGFDYTGFTHAAKIATIALDIALNQAAYSGEAAARHARHYRSIGLGFSNLAPLLLALGQAYDSATGRATAASIAALMTGTAYATSAEIAVRCGAAPAFKESRDATLRHLRQRQRAVYDAAEPHEQQGIALDDCVDLALIAAARRVWDQAVAGATAGLRNMRVTVVPDDNIVRDFLGAECSGITPLKRLTHDRQIDTDTFITEPLPQIASACAALGYTTQEQLALLQWQTHTDKDVPFPPAFPQAHRAVFTTLDYFGSNGIDPVAIIRMAGTIQPFITGSVAVHVPLPATATIAVIDEYAHMAVAAGLKNLRCLREGSPFDASNGFDARLSPQPAAFGHAFAALTPRTAEQGYARPNFQAVRTGSTAQPTLRVRVSSRVTQDGKNV
ncbi:MAG: hypothetical protein WBK91_03590 [Alphaproteobacteria bacterium]